SGFSTVSACGLVLSQNKLPPFGFNASLGAATSGSVAIGSLAAGTYYAQISCNEVSGRSSASSWSDAITVTITAPVVPVATPAPIATPSTPKPVSAAPQLQSVNPADGASAVALDIPVSALFDSPLVAQSGSALASLFKLNINNVDDPTLPVPAGSIAFPGTMTQPNANTLAFMPAANYPLLSRMTAQLSSGVAGTNGINSIASKQWSFMTRDGSWTATPDAKTALSPATSPVSPMVSAVGANGDILALRTESTALYAHYLPAGATTWTITTPDTHSNTAVQAAVDDQGNAYALWIQASYTLMLSVFNKQSATWSTFTVDSATAGILSLPQMSVFGGNQLRLVWYSYPNGGTGAIKTTSYSNIGGLNTLTAVSGASSMTSAPSALSMSVNNFGDYIIAWMNTGSIAASYQLAHGTDSSGTTPVTIASSPDQLSSLQSGIDDAGRATLMYVAKNSGTSSTKLIANVRQNATWTPHPLTSLSFSATISSPVLSVSSGSRARVAWFDSVSGVQTSAATSGTWQAAPDVINASTTVFDTTTPSHLLLTTNNQGDTAIAWGAPSSAAYYGCNLSVGHSTPVYTSVLSSTALSNLSLTLDQSGNATMLGLNISTSRTLYTTRIPRGQTNWSPMSAINSTSDTTFTLSPPSTPTTVANPTATSVDRYGRVYYVSTSSPSSAPSINVNIFK
ncbi:MAG: Ig-like domain-containing protein, partial [Proteobacteria bacterium]|nr:Ig-like domain-containing protein [Pseudomonadota bacterium]